MQSPRRTSSSLPQPAPAPAPITAPKSPTLVSMGRSRLNKEGFIKEVRDRLYDVSTGQWNGQFFVIRSTTTQSATSTANDETGAPTITSKKNLSIAPQTLSVSNCASSWNAARGDKIFSVFLGSPYWLTGKLEDVIEFLQTLGFEINESKLGDVILSPVKMLSLSPKELLLHASSTDADGAGAGAASADASNDKDATEIEQVATNLIDIATYLEGSLAQEKQEEEAAGASGSARSASPAASRNKSPSSAARNASSALDSYMVKLQQAKTEGGFVLDVTNWPRVVKAKSSTKTKHQLLSDLPIISSKFDNFLQAMITAGERDRMSFALRSANGKFDGQDIHAIYNAVASANGRPLTPIVSASPDSPAAPSGASAAAPASGARKRGRSVASSAAIDSGSSASKKHAAAVDDGDDLVIRRKSTGASVAASSYMNSTGAGSASHIHDDEDDVNHDDIYDNNDDNGDDLVDEDDM